MSVEEYKEYDLLQQQNQILLLSAQLDYYSCRINHLEALFVGFGGRQLSQEQQQQILANGCSSDNLQELSETLAAWSKEYEQTKKYVDNIKSKLATIEREIL